MHIHVFRNIKLAFISKNISGLDHDAFTEYGDRDIMTLPRDRTLGHGEGVPYGVPEQPGAYMSGPTDVSIRSS